MTEVHSDLMPAGSRGPGGDASRVGSRAAEGGGVSQDYGPTTPAAWLFLVHTLTWGEVT